MTLMVPEPSFFDLEQYLESVGSGSSGVGRGFLGQSIGARIENAP
jgi:hypothetical protein